MKGEMRIMNSKGDSRVEWDTANVETVERARAQFAELLLSGHLGFATIGTETRRISDPIFLEFAEKIVVTPPMMGG